MQWSLRAYAWLIVVLNGSGNLILRAFGCASTGHRHVHSPEEIALLIAESRDGGLLEPQEQVRLHRALRLGLRDARQLMVPRERLAAIDLATPWSDVLRIVATSPYSRLPVYRGTLDDIVGILHTKDVVTHFLERRDAGPLAEPRQARAARARHDAAPIVCSRSCASGAATRRWWWTPTTASSGMITLEDVLGELLGSVPDEFKTPRLLPLRLSNGRVRLPGELPLERARVWVEGAWPTDGMTVGEFIAREAGRVPEPGEKLVIWDLPVEIESVENDRIASVDRHAADARRRRTARTTRGGAEMVIAVLIISLLLLLNALFVAAEFAIVGAPRAAIDARAAKRQPLARLVQGVLRDPRRQDRYIATAQIGITVASLGLGMYGEHVGRRVDPRSDSGTAPVATWLAAHGFASVVAVAILTYFHIVVGEMMPEVARAAVGGADGALAHAADAVDPDAAATRSWSRSTASATSCCRRSASTAQAHSADQYYTSEELQLIVEESEEQGALRVGVGPGPAGALRVRRADRRRGDGAARPHHRHSGRRRARGAARDPRAARRARAIRSTKATSITSSARTTSRTCCGCF